MSASAIYAYATIVDSHGNIYTTVVTTTATDCNGYIGSATSDTDWEGELCECPDPNDVQEHR